MYVLRNAQRNAQLLNLKSNVLVYHQQEKAILKRFLPSLSAYKAAARDLNARSLSDSADGDSSVASPNYSWLGIVGQVRAWKICRKSLAHVCSIILRCSCSYRELCLIIF